MENIKIVKGGSIKEKLRTLRLRFKLWRKPKIDCCHCCVWCKYFESCRSDAESEKIRK